jgi:hypothetical protein
VIGIKKKSETGQKKTYYTTDNFFGVEVNKIARNVVVMSFFENFLHQLLKVQLEDSKIHSTVIQPRNALELYPQSKDTRKSLKFRFSLQKQSSFSQKRIRVVVYQYMMLIIYDTETN